jgi:hypothetical protein
MKLSSMQFSAATCYILHLRTKSSCDHTVLSHLQSEIYKASLKSDTISTAVHTTDEARVCHIL